MSKTMWLVRTTCRNPKTRRVRKSECWYLLFSDKPKSGDCDGWPYNEAFTMCPRPFEKATGIKLPPGGGPIKVRLQVVKGK